MVSKETVIVTSAHVVATPKFSNKLSGIIHAIAYVKHPDSAIAFDNGVDFTIKNKETGEEIWRQDDVDLSVTRYPRPFAQTPGGADLLYTAGEEVPVEGFMIVDQELELFIAQPGTDKQGTFIIYLKDAGRI